MPFAKDLFDKKPGKTKLKNLDGRFHICVSLAICKASVTGNSTDKQTTEHTKKLKQTNKKEPKNKTKNSLKLSLTVRLDPRLSNLGWPHSCKEPSSDWFRRFWPFQVFQICNQSSRCYCLSSQRLTRLLDPGCLLS